MAAPRDGGAAITLAKGQTSPLGLAVDATCAYFTSYSATGSIGRVDLR